MSGPLMWPGINKGKNISRWPDFYTTFSGQSVGNYLEDVTAAWSDRCDPLVTPAIKHLKVQNETAGLAQPLPEHVT